MSRKFVITENDILHIRSLYGLLNEQEVKILNASTTPEKMTNFGPNGNQKFGLKGDKSKENFTFASTLGDLVLKSTGDTASYFSNFAAVKDLGQYVDYVKIGGNEITDNGSVTIDLSKLPASTEVVATHNGLLILRRLMNELGGKKIGTATLSMSAGERASGQKNYNVKGIVDKLSPAFNAMSSIISMLLLPEDKRPNVKDAYAIKYLVGKSTDELKNILQTQLTRVMANHILAADDVANANAIIGDLNLTTTVDLGAFESLYGTGNVTPGLETSWSTLMTDIKKIMVDNFRLYLPEEFKYLADELSKSISDVKGQPIVSAYKQLSKDTELGQSSKTTTSTKSQTKTQYELGK